MSLSASSTTFRAMTSEFRGRESADLDGNDARHHVDGRIARAFSSIFRVSRSGRPGRSATDSRCRAREFAAQIDFLIQFVDHRAAENVADDNLPILNLSATLVRRRNAEHIQGGAVRCLQREFRFGHILLAGDQPPIDRGGKERQDHDDGDELATIPRRSSPVARPRR